MVPGGALRIFWHARGRGAVLALLLWLAGCIMVGPGLPRSREAGEASVAPPGVRESTPAMLLGLALWWWAAAAYLAASCAAWLGCAAWGLCTALWDGSWRDAEWLSGASKVAMALSPGLPASRPNSR